MKETDRNKASYRNLSIYTRIVYVLVFLCCVIDALIVFVWKPAHSMLLLLLCSVPLWIFIISAFVLLLKRFSFDESEKVKVRDRDEY